MVSFMLIMGACCIHVMFIVLLVMVVATVPVFMTVAASKQFIQ